MRFTISAAAFLALVSSALAQTADFDSITAPAKNEQVPAGSTYTVKWTAPAKYSGSVTIALIGGASQGSLQPVSTIATGVNNQADSYAWSVDSSLGADAVYGLVFTLESDTSVFQYSNPFEITGGSNSSATGVTTGSASATKTLSVVTSMTTSTAGNGTAAQTTQHKSTLTVTQGSSPTTTGSTTGSTGAAPHATAGAMFALGGFALAALAL